jgi:hypothetical protein
MSASGSAILSLAIAENLQRGEPLDTDRPQLAQRPRRKLGERDSSVNPSPRQLARGICLRLSSIDAALPTSGSVIAGRCSSVFIGSFAGVHKVSTFVPHFGTCCHI